MVKWKLRMKINEIITEVFNPETSFPIEWNDRHGPEEMHGRAYDRQGGFIDIKFIALRNGVVEVEFSRNDSYDMTGAGDANRVLATILEAFREYLQGYRPKIFVFSAKGGSRSKVYQNMINRFAAGAGYKQFDTAKLSDKARKQLGHSGSDVMILRRSAPLSEDIEVKHEPTSTGGVQVSAYIDGKEAGWVRFTKLKTGQVKAAMVHVPERLRRQGIGSAMYKYARHELGLDIVPSDSQTADGKAFWNKVHEEFNFEDRHPNDRPYGPETKPTMPKGTVRVDVSDVYDWYKLGMHISDLDGLGKHDFGKGPPSTIFSFGDEETEHKYIKDLEKTGLTTTDIDPKDPNQPKGMPRQKTDPTFNVNEEEFNGINITMDIEGDEIMVTAMANGRELGHVLFVEEGEYLMPQDLEVDERFQGQGIAAAMYDYVKSKGYKIRRSGQQTDAGAGFWGKHRPEQNVWENFADGKVKGKSRPGRVKRAGASCSGSVTDLRARAKNASGEKAKMYHWCANMKSGRKK
jgi:predicted GNAT family acetyltransferase